MRVAQGCGEDGGAAVGAEQGSLLLRLMMQRPADAARRQIDRCMTA